VWQFALAAGLTVAFGCALGEFLGLLWKHQLYWAAASGRWDELLGAAAGGLAGGAVRGRRFSLEPAGEREAGRRSRVAR
jgi:hypothetical protein